MYKYKRYKLCFCLPDVTLSLLAPSLELGSTIIQALFPLFLAASLRTLDLQLPLAHPVQGDLSAPWKIIPVELLFLI